MPQATTRLTKEWKGPSEHFAIGYLERRGYVLSSDWMWIIPKGVTPTPKDRRAVMFLFQEWDFGGFKNDPQALT